MRRIAAILFVFSLACCPTCPLFAQEGSATLTGFIQDSSKAVIPGVKVTAIDTNTNQRFEATTGKDGSYNIVSLPVGPYQMQIEKPGFKTILKDDLFLHTQDAMQVNFEMAVGSSSETVTVNGGSTSDSPGISLVVSHEFVEDMPLNGRSFQDLIALAPGAVNNGAYFSIDGQRNDANNFTVDGVSANLGVNSSNFGNAGVLPSQTILGTTQALASVDALEEFQVQTSGYAAEYGRQPGGQVAITTRSGTNEYHGTAFDFFRNTALDANDWFSNNAGIPRGALHQNDFGGTVGGPFLIPRLYNGKNRTFLFFNYEGLRLQTPYTDADTVPTLAFRQSASPAVQPFLDTYAVPNGVANPDGITAAFLGQTSFFSRVDSWGARIDHSLGSKLHIFGRISIDPTFTSNFTQPESVNQSNIQNTSSLTLGSTWSITPTFVNELRFNYARASGLRLDTQGTFGGSTPLPLTLLLDQQAINSGSYIETVYINVPNTSLSGGPQLDSIPSWQRQFNILDSFAWSRGKHAFKTGIDYRRLSPRVAGYGENQNYLEILSLSSVQNGIADQVYPGVSPDMYPVYTSLSVYAQDHWAMTRRLSIDYGLRWELNPPASFSSDAPVLALTAPITAANFSNAQFAPIGTPIYQTTYDNFAPRLGIAWTVRQSNNHPVVIKAGSGIFFDTGQANSGLTKFPVTYDYSYDGFGPVPLPLTAAELVTPPVVLPPTPPYFEPGLVEPNLKLPYTEQWNLSFEIGLNAKNTLTTSYIGNGGRRLLFSADFGSDNPAAIGNVQLASNSADSSYNALQVQDRGLVAPGLHLIASYSWSHSIDNISNDGNSSTVPDRGNADFDVRQVFNAALNYQIPSGSLEGVAARLASGWILANRFTAETGYPLQIVQGYYFPNGNGDDLEETIFPDLVPGVPVYLHNVPSAPGGWQLNPSAFATVPLNPDGSPTVIGTLGRNAVYGPAFWNLDTAVQRRFAITELLSCDFRVEAFNLFNHPNFGDINTTLGEATFGQAQTQANSTGATNHTTYATGSPRSLQLSLKLAF